jgi:hypothetical protein
MPDAANPWMTPKEIESSLGKRKYKEVFDDLIYDRRTRREILDLLTEATGCNEYAGEDFLRAIVKTQSGQ